MRPELLPPDETATDTTLLLLICQISVAGTDEPPHFSVSYVFMSRSFVYLFVIAGRGPGYSGLHCRDLMLVQCANTGEEGN